MGDYGVLNGKFGLEIGVSVDVGERWDVTGYGVRKEEGVGFAGYLAETIGT